jgi:hypothetical protein
MAADEVRMTARIVGDAGEVRDGEPVPTGADDAVATAELLDDCYRAAGFDLRPRTAPVG